MRLNCAYLGLRASTTSDRPKSQSTQLSLRGLKKHFEQICRLYNTIEIRKYLKTRTQSDKNYFQSNTSNMMRSEIWLSNARLSGRVPWECCVCEKTRNLEQTANIFIENVVGRVLRLRRNTHWQ